LNRTLPWRCGLRHHATKREYTSSNLKTPELPVGGATRPTPPRGARMIVKTGLQEFTQLDRGFELRDRIQFLERRRERIGKTPDRSRPEFLVLRFKVQVMYAAGEVLWGFQPPLDKCLVHDHLGGNILQFASRPLFFLGRGMSSGPSSYAIRTWRRFRSRVPVPLARRSCATALRR
jgi:hypothetical protein